MFGCPVIICYKKVDVATGVDRHLKHVLGNDAAI